MSKSFSVVPRICVGVLSVAVAANLALADGGTVRAIRQVEGLAITVFTSPTILTAGDVDISVLVQDAESRTFRVESEIKVTITPRERPYLAERHEASDALATNRLMKSCHANVTLGWHDVAVAVTSGVQRGQVRFAMQVGPPATRAGSYWPWFTWPSVPVALVAANLVYRRWRTKVQL